MQLKEEAGKVFNSQVRQQYKGEVEIIYYTDPLCCWSWGFEPQWRRLLYEFDGQIKYRYCMGGLLPGWKNYNDVLNSVSKPGQMGPVWMHAGHLSGMPILHNLWMSDPPLSSYPACIAVKCAGLQSQHAEEMYLRLVREAVMTGAENISAQKVLMDVADKLSTMTPEFNFNRFEKDMKSDTGLEAFRKDLQEIQSHNINRFPTLVIKNKSNQAIIIPGYRPYNVLLSAVKQLADLKKTHEKITREEYKKYWPSLTERELAEIDLAAENNF